MTEERTGEIEEKQIMEHILAHFIEDHKDNIEDSENIQLNQGQLFISDLDSAMIALSGTIKNSKFNESVSFKINSEEIFDYVEQYLKLFNVEVQKNTPSEQNQKEGRHISFNKKDRANTIFFRHKRKEV